ncbi:MAG: hypothetical protein ACRBN8_21620 [Nannocystales bacterium]
MNDSEFSPGEFVDTDGESLRINGEIEFDGCSAPEQSRIEDAMSIIMGKLHSDAYLECVGDAFMTEDRGHLPEEVLARLRQDMPTLIECKDQVCGTDSAVGCAGVGISDERISVKRSYVMEAEVESVAGVILHEVAHNKNYNHPGSWFEPDSRFRAIRQVQECMRSGEPDGLLRSQAPGETELARIGGHGGSPFDLSCPPGRVSTGFRVDSSADHVNRIRMHCEGTDTGSVGAYYDSTSTRDRSCPAGQVVVGVRGATDNHIGNLTMLCASETAVENMETGYDSARWLGGGDFSGHAVERVCPAGMAVSAIHGRSGARIDQLRVVCQDHPTNPRGPNRYLTAAGSTAGSSERQFCSGYGAMVGLWGRAGGEVDRLGGRCRPTGSTFLGVPFIDGSEYQTLEARGGLGGEVNFDDQCPDGQLMVGLQVRGDRVGRVRATCADPGAWVGGSSFPALSYTPYRGANTNGTLRTRTCERGEFVVGLETWAGQTVHATPTAQGTRPICRRLGTQMQALPVFPVFPTFPTFPTFP